MLHLLISAFKKQLWQQLHLKILFCKKNTTEHNDVKKMNLIKPLMHLGDKNANLFVA